MNLKEGLKNAICVNDVAFIEENISNFSINERFEDEDNDTLLLFAISDSSSLAYKCLLKIGADVTLVNDEGEGILHGIVYSGDHIRLIEVMDKYKININHRSYDGATPLLLAVSLGRIDIALTLIEYGADVNVSDNEGISSLHLAGQIPNVNLLNSLLDHGADVFVKTNQGNLALALAVNSGHIENIKILYQKTMIL